MVPGKLVLGDFCFFRKHNRDIVANRIDAAAGAALQAGAVGEQSDRGFAKGTNQNSEKLFRNGHVCLRSG
jgi:hypothetical protein